MRRLLSLTVLAAVIVPLTTGPLPAQEKQDKKKVKKANPVLAQIEDKPGLPRVLLIGDSISMGYTLPVREMLAGKANVHRPAANCASTKAGVLKINDWLGDKKWDVIHFNWGLHDIVFHDANGKNATPATGSHQVAIADYEKNLRELVKRLKATNAKLIWCATTPVPAGTTNREAGDEVKYNEIAAKIMQDEGIPTDDLYAFALPQLEKIQLPKNVHFTPEGSKVLAQKVSEEILKQLPAK